jgi:hypothetical protein
LIKKYFTLLALSLGNGEDVFCLFGKIIQCKDGGEAGKINRWEAKANVVSNVSLGERRD